MNITSIIEKQDITQTDNLQQKIKKIIGNLVSDHKITLDQFEQYNKYIAKKLPFKNGLFFEKLVKNFPDAFVNIEIDSIVDVTDLVKQMKSERKNIISFTKERMCAIHDIFTMIHDNTSSLYGLYGFAGSGKTTMILEIINFLAHHHLISNIAFSAPTHKALNVMKSSFCKLMPTLMDEFGIKYHGMFDSDLLELKTRGLNIEFVTIHGLMGFGMELTKDGEREFVKKATFSETIRNLCKYDIIIIDECSMIPLQMIIEIFRVIHEQMRKACNFNDAPKIIFSGDPAQLPPVNEISSAIFIHSKEEIPFAEYERVVPKSQISSLLNKKNSAIEINRQSEYELMISDIINMKKITLTEIFRNSHANVTNLCTNIRNWVISNTKLTIKNYIGPCMNLYCAKGKNKIETEWFQKCVDAFKSNKSMYSNIILTWTNKACDTYNTAIREKLFNKTKLNDYEVGDILILNDFYSFNNDSEKKCNKKDDSDDRFYTSEQIKILELQLVMRQHEKLKLDVPKSFSVINYSANILQKVRPIVNKINKLTDASYKVWKMNVVRLSDNSSLENINKEYTIYVTHAHSKEILEDNTQRISGLIKSLTNSFQSDYPSNIDVLEKLFLKPMWNYWYNTFMAPYADVIFGYSITTHKSQGSTFNDVFIDVKDILQNKNENELKRCIYTSHSRCSNELHLLI